VIVAAGSDTAAGTGTGGQVLTLSGNSITQNNGGSTYVYSGQASGTGQLSHLSSAFNQLVYQGSGLSQNSQFNKAFGDSTIAGAPAQVLFREAAGPSFSLTLNDVSKTYGDADPTLAVRNSALLSAYTGPDTLTTTVNGANSGSNTFAVEAADVINGLTGTSRAAGSNVGTYAYTNVSASAFNTTLSGQPNLVVHQRDITLSAVTAATKVYDGNTTASISGGTFGNIVGGETLALTGSGYFDSPNVNGVSTVTVDNVTALVQAAGGTGAWSNYNLTTTGAITNSATGKITPATLTATVNNSAVFVTIDPNSAPDMGVSYSGFVVGDSAATALSGTYSRTYTGAATPNAGTYNNVFGLSATPTALNGNYTITVDAGDLRVLPADLLMVTVNSQNSTYGTQVERNNDFTTANSVTAQYCLDKSNCSTGLSTLNMSRIGDTRWRATDGTGSSVEFDTTIDSPIYSSGRYLTVSNYDYDITPISLVSLQNIDPNFTGTYINAGVLTVDPLTLSPSMVASNKTFDGTTQVTITNTSSGLSGDVATIAYVSAAFDSPTAGSNKTVTVSGLSLSGTDASNYRLASPTHTTTASILSGSSDGSKPQPPVVKPVVPGPVNPTPNGGGQTSLDDASGTNSNPFSLSVGADDCRLDNLSACECEPNPLDETMDICYVPNRSGQASAAYPRS
jgi:hypothetical protein